MNKKGSLKKLSDFWIIPVLAGGLFSAGYEFTNRKLAFGKYSNQKRNAGLISIATSRADQPMIVKTNEIGIQPNTQTIISLIDKEPKKKTPMDSNETIKKMNGNSSSPNENVQLKITKKTLDNILLEESGRKINPKIESKKIVFNEEEKFIESLFNSLPEP